MRLREKMSSNVNCASLHDPALNLSFKTALDVLFELLRLFIGHLVMQMIGCLSSYKPLVC